MLQIRHSDGSVTAIPETGHFVEIVNEHDKTVGLVLMQPQPGMVIIIEPGSRDAQRYAEMFQNYGVKFAATTIHRRI